jgi:hypothetical protein
VGASVGVSVSTMHGHGRCPHPRTRGRHVLQGGVEGAERGVGRGGVPALQRQQAEHLPAATLRNAQGALGQLARNHVCLKAQHGERFAGLRGPKRKHRHAAAEGAGRAAEEREGREEDEKMRVQRQRGKTAEGARRTADTTTTRSHSRPHNSSNKSTRGAFVDASRTPGPCALSCGTTAIDYNPA